MPCAESLEARVLLSLVPSGDAIRLYQPLPDPTGVANSDIAMDADGDFAIVSELSLPRPPGGRDPNFTRVQLFAQQAQPVGELLYPDERGLGGRAPQIAMSRTGD